jgi:hypothetical protein
MTSKKFWPESLSDHCHDRRQRQDLLLDNKEGYGQRREKTPGWFTAVLVAKPYSLVENPEK